MQTTVIYHGGCWDGFCAAWLLHHKYPDAEFVPAVYGQEPPESAEDKTRRLFIVDFSYPRNVMFRLGAMRKSASCMTVLDHHKTAEAALEGLSDELASNNCGGCEIIFDMAKSGGRLTWEYLRGEQKSPWLVDYTEDRDLWRFELPDSREITSALRTFPLDFDVWNKMMNEEEWWKERLRADGIAIRRYEELLVDQHVRHAVETEMDGHKILAVNATVLFSDIAGKLAEDRPFGAAYFVRDDGKTQWSLRSRDGGIDVSEVAKKRGGGGHRNAAGFEE